MLPAPDAMAAARATRTWPQRLFGRWWRRQSPSRQDRFATLGPLVSVLLFLAAMISAFWYLRNEEIEREAEAVKRDTEIAQQQVRLRLIENQEQLVRIARELTTRAIDARDFNFQALALIRDRPELTQVMWISAQRERRSGVSQGSVMDDGPLVGTRNDPSLPKANQSSSAEMAFAAAREKHQPIYSQPFISS